MKSFFGGSEQKSTSSSGFSLLPQEIQGAFKNLATQASGMFGNGGGTSMFGLPSLSAGAQKALDSIMGQSYTPTADSVKSDIAMQTNPFDSSVIDTINRAAAGQGSVLNSYLTNAGTFGSNRGALGANDIDLTRLNQIGTFKQNQYNTALNNALTTLPQLRMSGAQNAVNAGLTQQGQTSQNMQAPYTALAKFASLLGVLPQNGGSTSTSTGESWNPVMSSFSWGGGGKGGGNNISGNG